MQLIELETTGGGTDLPAAVHRLQESIGVAHDWHRETMSTTPTLLERIANGDRAAVDLCIKQYSGLVWSLARRYIANEADAEEAVQDVFMELWSQAARFDAAKASEPTWISLIARRRLIDRLRREQRQPKSEPLADVEQLLTRDGRAAIEASAETRRVMEVIDAMNPEQRQVIRMSAWLGMSHAAIAERTDLPLGTVKSHLRRGLTRIREQLGIDTATPNGGARP
jgi:RNA polymerase sigma-70 factor (ECF subfamily)